MVVVLVAAACSSGESKDEPVDQGGTASTSAAVAGSTTVPGSGETTVPASTTVAAASEWIRVPDDPAVFDGEGRQSINAVAAGGPGLVAVGVDDRRGAVWTSPDGRTWTRVPDDDGVFDSERGPTIHGVAAGGPGVVAVGEDANTAVVWTSPDGTTWSRVPDADGFPDDTAQIHDVITGGPGLIAVGYSVDTEGSAGTVWTSSDGVAWTRTAFPIDGGQGAMQAVTAGGPGFVAVGSVRGDDVDAAVWTSPDGVDWTPVPHSEEVFGGPDDQTMEAVAAGGPGLVAVGQDYNGEGVGAAVWTSADGLTWSKVPSTLDTFGGSRARGMWGVTSDGSGLVAVGAVGSGSAIWTSPDGTVWTQVPQNDGSFDKDGGAMFDVIQGGPGLIAVGQEYSGPDPDAAVWTRASSG